MYADKEYILHVYSGHNILRHEKIFKVNKRYIKARTDGVLLQTDGELSPIGVLDLNIVEWEECECTKMSM